MNVALSRSNDDDTTGATGGNLRTLLLNAGVRSKWTPADLARRSDKRVARPTWSRLTADLEPGAEPFLCHWNNLSGIVDTLREAQLGDADYAGGRPRITLEEAQQAWLLDKGNNPSTGYDTLKRGAATADVVVGMIEGLPSSTDRVRFLREMVAGLSPQERVAFLQGFVADLAPQERVTFVADLLGGPARGGGTNDGGDGSGSGS